MSKNFAENIKTSLKNFFKRKDPAEFFVAAMAVSLILFLICALCGGIAQFTGIFFLRGDDLFMDYFNSIRDAAQGTGVYTERNVIYPPMANLIFLVCMRFVPAEYAATSFDDRKTWVNYPSAILSCLFFFLIFALLFLLLCKRKTNRNGFTRSAFAFFTLVNVPLLYMLERGNILLLSTLFSAVYIFTYDSGRKTVRELGLLSLAFSFSLKLYPAIFGWTLIADKRYKEAVRCIVYALLMLVLPSFCFGGPKCLVWMFENIFSFSSGSGGWTEYIANFLHIPAVLPKIALYVLLAVAAVFFLAASFIQKERWKVWVFACALLTAMPALCSLYAWGIFLVPLILFCNRAKLDGINKLYFLFMAIPFLFFPSFAGASLNRRLFLPALLALLVVCIADTLSALIRKRAGCSDAGPETNAPETNAPEKIIPEKRASEK